MPARFVVRNRCRGQHLGGMACVRRDCTRVACAGVVRAASDRVRRATSAAAPRRMRPVPGRQPGGSCRGFHVLRGAGRLPFPWQQLVQLMVLGSARDDALQHVGQPAQRVDTVQPRRGEKRGRRPFSSTGNGVSSQKMRGRGVIRRPPRLRRGSTKGHSLARTAPRHRHQFQGRSDG